MGAGIECYDGNGTLTLRTDFLLTKYLGKAETGGKDGYLEDDRLNGDNFWVSVIEHGDTGNWARGWIMPNFTVNGNKLQWKHTGTNYGVNVNVVFAYGVY